MESMNHDGCASAFLIFNLYAYHKHFIQNFSRIFCCCVNASSVCSFEFSLFQFILDMSIEQPVATNLGILSVEFPLICILVCRGTDIVMILNKYFSSASTRSHAQDEHWTCSLLHFELNIELFLNGTSTARTFRKATHQPISINWLSWCILAIKSCQADSVLM